MNALNDADLEGSDAKMLAPDAPCAVLIPADRFVFGSFMSSLTALEIYLLLGSLPTILGITHLPKLHHVSPLVATKICGEEKYLWLNRSCSVELDPCKHKFDDKQTPFSSHRRSDGQSSSLTLRAG